jgi:hypothetical protein
VTGQTASFFCKQPGTDGNIPIHDFFTGCATQTAQVCDEFPDFIVREFERRHLSSGNAAAYALIQLPVLSSMLKIAGGQRRSTTSSSVTSMTKLARILVRFLPCFNSFWFLSQRILFRSWSQLRLQLSDAETEHGKKHFLRKGHQTSGAMRIA